MNQRQLKYFLAVYEKKSISKAAQELYISPQGLSKTIASLEAELGIELFKHNHNRIVPTAYAARLSVHAKNILDEYELITEKLFLEKGSQKTLNVYCSYDVPQLIPGAFFQRFNQEYPNICISLKEYPDSEIIHAVEENKIELAIVPGPFDTKKLGCIPLCTEPFCVVVNKKNALANNSCISFEQLNNYPLVIKDSTNPTSISQLHDFMKMGVTPTVILETTDANLIHEMAQNNYAVGISLLYLAKKIRSDRIRVIPFKEKWLTKTLYLTYNQANVLSYEAELFKNALVSFFENSCPD